MSADNASRLPVELVDHLREVKSWVRWQWLLRGFGRVAVLVSLSLVTVFLLDFRLDLNPTARLAAFWSIGAATSIALLGWLVIPLCRRMSWSELAALADKAHPEWEDSLTSAVELNDPSQPDGFKGSPVMRQMLLEQTRQRVEELDLERVVSSRRAWRSVKLGSAACLLLAAPVFFAPSSYRQLWQRLLMPSGNWGTVGAWQIEVADGDRVVARGADVELLAKATKTGNAEPPKSLLLEWRDTVGTTDRRAMPYDAARQAFATIVPHVMRDLKFHVSVERQQSRDYQVRVVEPPVVTQVRVDIEPPAYAGWPAQSLDGAVGAIRVFERSRLKFKLEFNKPIESASLVWRQGGEPLTFDLAADKQSALMEMLADPKVFGPYAFAIADIHKLTNNDIVPRELIVVADEPPHLIVKGDQSAEVRPDDAVPIDVTATDDIGIGQLELHFKINEGKTQKLIAENVQGQKEVGHRFTLDLSSLKVEQGQWLTYKIRTTDERPDPGPHEVWSDVRVLRISTKAPPPGFNELAKTQEELRQELKQLQNDVVQRQRDIEAHRKQSEIAERTKKEPLPPERLQQLEQQIAELKQRGEKLADQLAADPLFHELGEQVRDVAEQQLPAAAQEVKQAQQDAGREQIDELRRGEQQLADAAKKLQQVEKPFQQLAELQKDLLELNRLARQADQLANRADELNREQAANEPREEQKSADAQNADPQEKANQQAESAEQAQKLAADEKQLAKDQAKLADALNDLLKRRPELLNAAKRDELDRLAQLAEQAKELAKEQQELADAIKERQQETAESAKELADRQQDLTERAEKASLEAEKQDDTKSVKPVNPESLREAVAALQEGNLDKAQKQQELAANELDRLAVELENAKADSKKPDQSPLVQAARELADEQKKLADKADEAQKSDDAELKQKAAEQLQRDQAKLNERIENLPANTDNKPADASNKNPADKPNADKPSGDKPSADKPNGDAKLDDADAKPADSDSKPNPAQVAQQEAEKRAEQAEQALAEGNLEKAAQEQRRTEQALRELAKQAAQPMNAGGDPAMPEQLAQLAKEQRQLAKEVAQALNEQRGEQSKKDDAQPAAPSEQANAKNGNEQPMPQPNANEPGQQAPQKPGDQSQEPPAGQPAQQTQAAQQQRQEQLSEAAGKLGEKLEQAQNRLSQKPLNMQKSADGAQAAKEQTASSQENMQAAKQADQSGNPGEAAKSANEAAKQLQQAAEKAQAASEGNQPPKSPVSNNVGKEVAKAAERLRQASEKQSEAKKDQEGKGQQGEGKGKGKEGGQDEGKGQSQPGKGEPGQGESKGESGQCQSNQAGEGKSPGQGQQGESEGQGKGQSQGQGQESPSSQEGQTAERRPFAEAARLLREAARALADAAKQSSPQPSQGRLPQPGQPSNDPNGNPQLANAGGNGQGSVEQDRGENLSDLPIQVKKVTGRNWGQLSSKLQTELTQAAKHQAHGDYSKLIKLYFQEIAKTQGSAAPEKKP